MIVFAKRSTACVSGWDRGDNRHKKIEAEIRWNCVDSKLGIEIKKNV